MLIGRVGKDPDIKDVSGVKVANFSLATTDRAYKTQSGAVVPERTEWHNIVVWRGLADVVENYVKKGSQIYIEGKIRTRSWEDQTGMKRYSTEMYADNLELSGARQESHQNQNANYGGFAHPTTHQFQTANAQDLSDDLPF